MGWQIIKQPNGKYCIFSSVGDNVIEYDLDREGIINVYIEEETERIKQRVSEIIDKLDSGGKPYFQFQKSFEEMIETIRSMHGDEEADGVIDLISPSESPQSKPGHQSE